MSLLKAETEMKAYKWVEYLESEIKGKRKFKTINVLNSVTTPQLEILSNILKDFFPKNQREFIFFLLLVALHKCVLTFLYFISNQNNHIKGASGQEFSGVPCRIWEMVVCGYTGQIGKDPQFLCRQWSEKEANQRGNEANLYKSCWKIDTW